MSELSVQLDLKGFEAELKRYQEATKKDMAYVVNRAMNSWAIESAKFMRDAIESRIASLKTLPWWPKLIARIMVARRAARFVRAIEKGKNARWNTKRAYTRKQAQVMSRKIINSRVKSRTFIRGFFLRWSQAIAIAVPGIKGPLGATRTGAKFFENVNAVYIPATTANLNASVHVWYDYKRRSGKGVAVVEAMFARAKAAGLLAAMADMRKYVAGLKSKSATGGK